MNLFKEIVTKNLPGSQVKDDDTIKISDFTNSAVYSSTAQETKRELETHYNNLQGRYTIYLNSEKRFFLLSNKFYKGDIVTEDSLVYENIDCNYILK